jgi:hypothetical protein
MSNDLDERRLEEALKKYGEAEPRPGLEIRILANLSAKREQLASKPWRWRLAAATLALGGVALVGLLIMRRPEAPRVNVTKEVPIAVPSRGTALSVTPDRKIVSGRRPSIHRNSERHVAIQTEPRLEQFPSPHPLNVQEEMLARYIRERREEAVMVARARAELLKQELAGFPGNSSEPTEDTQE